jgi:glyoxylase-like metal-dependent hydrolase (beta-lactamase superfamily II)
MKLKQLVFNPLQENTYVIWDESSECAIVDPGCFHRAEREELEAFIANQHLKPVRLLLTHAHFDHVFGCRWAAERWNLTPELHAEELPVLRMAVAVAQVYGFRMEAPPETVDLIETGKLLRFGKTELEVRHTPGHSPGSVSFYHAPSGQVVVGDVLFRGSIGRTDLPGGSMDTLERSIRQQLYTLPDATTVWSGHGPETSIAHEKAYNPFVPA